jgi:mRNA interferase HicA
MKRRVFIRYLSSEGCIIHREGAKHTVYLNPENGRFAAVPRHREILIALARKICRQLEISPPKEKA